MQESLEGSEELGAGGVYLLPEAIACNGELVGIQACAFLNQLMNTTLFILTVGVFRAVENDTQELDLIYLQILNIISNASQGCAWSHSQQLSVNKGDRVGVEIRDTCQTRSSGRRACPAQVNLINSSCASALYHPPLLVTHIRLSDFTAVGVNLNVQVSIGETVQGVCVVFECSHVRCTHSTCNIPCVHTQLKYNNYCICCHYCNTVNSEHSANNSTPTYYCVGACAIYSWRSTFARCRLNDISLFTNSIL